MINANDFAHASVGKNAFAADAVELKGRYVVECRGAAGELRWREEIENLVPTVGKNLLLDTILAGSAYTVTGPYMGLIAGAGYSTGPNAADTMASHGGWNEAGNAHNPTYSGTRKTCVFSAASGGAKALSAALTFSITSAGPDVVKGVFLTLGTGASSTIDNTSGTLFSAVLFTGGDRSVSNGDTISATWSLSC